MIVVCLPIIAYHQTKVVETSQSGTSPSIWNCLQLRWNASAFGTSAPGSSSSTRSDQPHRMMEMRPGCWCFSTGKALMPCFQLMLILGKRQQELTTLTGVFGTKTNNKAMKQNKHLQTTYIYICILDHSGTLLRQLDNHVVLGPLGRNMRSNSLLHTCHVQICRNAFGDTGPAVMPVCWITKMSSSTWPIVNTNPQKEQTHASKKRKRILISSSWQREESIPTKGTSCHNWLPVCNGLPKDLALPYWTYTPKNMFLFGTS